MNGNERSENQWTEIRDPMTVAEVTEALGMTSQGLTAWASRHAGPYRQRVSPGDDGVRYERAEVEAVRDSMLVLGSYRLRVKNADKPLGRSSFHAEDKEKLTASSVKQLLGVTQTVLTNWRYCAIGPLAVRIKAGAPLAYRKSHVMELRGALVALGKYKLGLPESPRHLTADTGA